jgi:DNA-binding transcriptional LysR family regulator
LAHPKIEIQYVVTDRRPGVRAEDFDVVIQTKRPTDGDVIHRKLLSSRRVVCATPQYIERHGAPASPSELRNHNCIRMIRGHEIYSKWRFCENETESDVEVSGSLVASSTDVIHGWLRGGYGIAMKALWDVEQELDDGRLVEVLRPFACDDIHLYATFATRSHLPPRIRLLLDFVAAGLSSASTLP